MAMKEREGVSDKQRHGGMHHHACFPDAACVWVGAQDKNQLMKVIRGDILKQTKHFSFRNGESECSH